MIRVDSRKKRDTLADMLRTDEVRSALVFCNRKTTVRELATSLKRGHFNVGQIQGDMAQSDRIKELDRFKNDEINILVASDVAARGLDIKGVSHVFNYDVPWHPDDYVHRIGRTGRAGKTGIAITLVTGADAESIDNIQKLTGTKIAEMGGGEGRRRPKRSRRRARKSRAANAAPAATTRPEPRAPRPEPEGAESPERAAAPRSASASPSPKPTTAAGTARSRASSARASAADDAAARASSRLSRLLLPAAPARRRPAAAGRSRFRAFLQTTFAERPRGVGRTPRYVSAFADLNGDGRDEAFVSL